ncbi:AMP-binding protein [Rhodococcus fascians]|uniref:AMP-binding protein n=1 Tax=Rhodococcus sp. 05-2255-1e TaxID=2022495 RepID=UPI000B9AE330|nr:AMP-binding protein [Rhodococcus sp. 05-2255-1e]MBY4273560.1 AMP-binding protein [Rhodococcus fascians]MBY4430747.1 AMP-binding protein [Rhodococcus fascians]OZE23535.1 cyclohexanecarboxylate-CoA ligase [Rhodococcus sp. 05-2255-1e]
MFPTRLPIPAVAQSFRADGHWQDKPVGYFLTRAARRFPNALAVVDGHRRLTFTDVEQQVNVLASALRGRGIGADSVVSFQLPNCAEAVIVFQALMKLGAVANPIVPIYRGREVRFILGQARSAMVFVPSTYRGFDYEAMYRDLGIDVEVVVVGGESWAALLDEATPDGLAGNAEPDADSVCLLLYTSGTTADPKGVLHSHNTLVYENQSIIDWFGLNERDVVFNPSPVTHVTGVNCALTLPFLLGAPVVLQEIWDPSVAMERIVSEGASFMIFSTPFLRGLLDAADASAVSTPSIRYIVCGGADIPDALTAAATTRLGTVVRMFGATEGPSVSCTDRWDTDRLRMQSDGRPMTPTEVIVSVDGAGIAEPGVVGEVLWRGPDTFLGYLDSSLNDAAFTPDGFFRSGDLATTDSEGGLHIVGRIKDIINRSGEKISTYDVENLLSEHPDVLEVAVVAGPDPRTGERGCAFVVTRDEHELSLRQVYDFLSGREVAIQKIPESVFVVDSLPKTASGKIQKFALRDWTRDRSVIPPPMAEMTVTASDEK